MWLYEGAVGPTSSRPGPVVVEIPLEKIRRPLMRTRANDPDKVKDLMDSISQIGLQVPVHLQMELLLVGFFFFFLIPPFVSPENDL